LRNTGNHGIDWLMSLRETLPQFEAYTSDDATLVAAGLVIVGAVDRINTTNDPAEMDRIIHESHMALLDAVDVALRQIGVTVELQKMGREFGS
jgi:hypothetical protein